MTPAERERRFTRIREIGCLACRQIGIYMEPDVHHQNLGAHAGGKRLGDDHTVGLCPYHHRGVPGDFGSQRRAEELLGPSLAKSPNLFRIKFGSDADLLAEQNRLIAEAERKVVGRIG